MEGKSEERKREGKKESEARKGKRAIYGQMQFMLSCLFYTVYDL